MRLTLRDNACGDEKALAIVLFAVEVICDKSSAVGQEGCQWIAQVPRASIVPNNKFLGIAHVLAFCINQPCSHSEWLPPVSIGDQNPAGWHADRRAGVSPKVFLFGF